MEENRQNNSINNGQADTVDMSKLPNDNSISTSHLNPEKLAPHKRAWNWTKNLSKKQKIILLVAAILLVAGGCAAAYSILTNQPGPLSSANGPVSKLEPSKMTGLMVDPEVNEKQVTAVMIENSPDARPQAGLIDAGVVYEAVAEGGITRFVALFQDTNSGYLGPVRSVRPYYLDWLVPYDAAVAHVGGSPQALGQVKSQKIKDLDQFSNPSAYDRVNTRFAPHNVYTSTKRLDKIEKERGYKKSDYDGFARLRSASALEKPKAKTIKLNYSSDLYNVTYKYNKKCNCYKRFLAGQPHTDEKSKKQISPKVVIAIEMNRSQDGVYSVYQTTGSGKVRIYQNGDLIKGKWKKKDRQAQFVFVDNEGKNIKLAPGKTWVSIVEPGRAS